MLFLVDLPRLLHQPFGMLDEDVVGVGRRRRAALPYGHDVDIGLHPQAFFMGGFNGDGQRIPAWILADHVILAFMQFDGPWVDVGLVERRGFASNL